MTDSLPYLIYLAFAVGGAAIYFALPRSGQSTAKAGAIIGLAAVAVLIVVCVSYAAPREGAGYAHLFTVIALFAAGRTITHPKPVYCVLYFVLVVVAVAGLLVMQGAEFLGIALVIVYAGAILVTYTFVIMMAQQSPAAAHDLRSREPFLAVLAGFVTMAAIAGQVTALPAGRVAAAATEVRVARSAAEPAEALGDAHTPGRSAPADAEADPGAPSQPAGNTAAVGRALFTTYVVSLQAAGVLLLVAMVGGIVVCKKRIPAEELPVAEKPLGQIGREVPPF